MPGGAGSKRQRCLCAPILRAHALCHALVPCRVWCRLRVLSGMSALARSQRAPAAPMQDALRNEPMPGARLSHLSDAEDETSGVTAGRSRLQAATLPMRLMFCAHALCHALLSLRACIMHCAMCPCIVCHAFLSRCALHHALCHVSMHRAMISCCCAIEEGASEVTAGRSWLQAATLPHGATCFTPMHCAMPSFRVESYGVHALG